MRIPPRKARLVANTVIGMPVKDALVVLQFTPRAAAAEVAKVVKSAAANATNNFSQDEDALIVKQIIVNEGPTIKRGRPRARGMYFSIFKRTSHITAVVDTEVPLVAPRRRRRPAAEEAEVAKPKKTDRKADKKADAKAAPPKVAETKAEPSGEAKAGKGTADQGTAKESKAEQTKVEGTKAEATPEQDPEVEAAVEETRAEEAETEAAEVEPSADADAADDTDKTENADSGDAQGEKETT